MQIDLDGLDQHAKDTAPVRLKDHLFRELVNDLRDIATEWHGSQQLRERISGRLRKSIEPSATPCQGHARQQEAEELAEWVEQKEKALHEKFIASLGGQEAKSGD